MVALAIFGIIAAFVLMQAWHIDSVADVFDGDAFTTYALTKAFKKIPPAPTTINELGIFRGIPIPGTLVMIEEKDEVLALIPTTHRGGPGIPGQRAKREGRPFKVPHIQVDDTVHADDVLNVRQFGSNNPQSGPAAVSAELMIAHRQSIDVTVEYLRLGALLGTVTYPTNSIDSDLNLFTEFSVTQQTQDCALGTAGTQVVESIIPAIRDKVEAGLGGTPYSDIYCLCGRNFFRALIGHVLVKGIYDHQQQMWATQAVTTGTGTRANRMRVRINGITFEEYYGAVSGVTMLNSDVAIAFPLGADIFIDHYAPADFLEAVGTLGQEAYARMYPSPDGKSMNLEVQANRLPLCTQPRALVYCSKTAF